MSGELVRQINIPVVGEYDVVEPHYRHLWQHRILA